MQQSLLGKLSVDLIQAAESGQIGIPRFIRWTQPTGPRSEFRFALDLCERLFGSAPERSDVMGADGYQTQLLIWSTGESAIFSQSSGSPSSLPEIMLLGSAGAIYFDGTLEGTPTLEQVVQS
ncbi:MAG: hypothetical protein ACPHK0_04985 [Dehalococcoidia bacterium]